MKNTVQVQLQIIHDRYSQLQGGHLAALATANSWRLANNSATMTPRKWKKLVSLIRSQERRASRQLGIGAAHW